MKSYEAATEWLSGPRLGALIYASTSMELLNDLLGELGVAVRFSVITRTFYSETQ